MATTVVTSKNSQPIGAFKIAIFELTIGAADTTATLNTGMANVYAGHFEPDSAEDNGQVIINSNAGTKGEAPGHVYISGLANSTTGILTVFGF